MMSPDQENHLKEVVSVATALMQSKYREGQKKHEGNLFDLTASDLIDEAIMEAIDQLVYLITTKAKLTENKQFNVRN